MCIFKFVKSIKKRQIRKQISSLENQAEELDAKIQSCLRNADDIKQMISIVKYEVQNSKNLQLNFIYFQNIDNWNKQYLDFRNAASKFIFQYAMVLHRLHVLDLKLQKLN